MVTLLLWGYFTLGFLIIFSPFYLAAYLFSENRENSFQRLNHHFYKGFFFLIRTFIPGQKWRISGEIGSIRSSVIVCNHQSYLDPLLVISLFKQHKTIVKSTFFKVPIFGWILKQSGYFPSTSEGKLSELMIESFDTMDDFLTSGGNLFIFPEGTRKLPGQKPNYKIGGAMLAKSSGYDVLPIAHNAGEFWPKGQYIKKPGLIKMVIGPVIKSSDLKTKQINQQAEQWIESTIESLYQKHD